MSVMPDTPPVATDEMKAFLMVVRQALLMVIGYIEKRYGLNRRI